MNESRQPIDASGPVVLRVDEGHRSETERIFSVVLDRASDDFSVVAAAVDPASGLPIPAAGDAHPDDETLLAEAPTIFAVGLKWKNGPMIASHSAFFNVRVTYVAGTTGPRGHRAKGPEGVKTT